MWRNYLILGVSLSLFGCSGSKPKLPEVRLVRVDKADLSVRYVGSGRVRSRAVKVSPLEGGRLKEIRVEANQPVTQGQLLAVIDDQELRQAQRQLDADLMAARNKIAQIQATMAVHESQQRLQDEIDQRAISDSQLSITEDRLGPTAEARAQTRDKFDAARKGFKLAEVEYNRQRAMFKEDVAAQADVEKAKVDYDEKRSAFEQARLSLIAQQKGSTPIQKTRLQRGVESARINAMMSSQKAQETKLEAFSLKAAQTDLLRLESAVALNQFRMTQTRIVAPVSGTVSQVDFEPYELISPKTPFVTITTPGPYWVEAEIDEQDAVYVTRGQLVRVSFTSLPGKTFGGKVSEIAPSLEPRPQGPVDHKVLKIRVVLTEKVPQVRSGLEADVEGKVELAKGVPSIPRAALHRDGGEDYVLTVQNNHLQRVPVRVGAVSNERAEVKQGPAEGTEVVVEGGDGVPVGAEVNPIR